MLSWWSRVIAVAVGIGDLTAGRHPTNRNRPGGTRCGEPQGTIRADGKVIETRPPPTWKPRRNGAIGGHSHNGIAWDGPVDEPECAIGTRRDLEERRAARHRKFFNAAIKSHTPDLVRAPVDEPDCPIWSGGEHLKMGGVGDDPLHADDARYRR